MSDESVRAALRSDAKLVLIEAPAGCGKTHQGAEYVREVAAANRGGRTLILTHTHGACSVFAERTHDHSKLIEIRTIDSVIGGIASAYHTGLGLPPDPAAWARRQPKGKGYDQLAVKVSALVNRYPMIASSLAHRYGVVVCDEHQDSSGDQHAFVMALHRQGTQLRVFADPVQKIFREDTVPGGTPPYSWSDLSASADVVDSLDHPHRWNNGCRELGNWTLKARQALKTGGKVDLRHSPPSVEVVWADNIAQRNLDYRISPDDRKPVDVFERRHPSLLVLTRHNDTARAIRALFFRKIPLWEGHTRTALETLADAAQRGGGPESLAAAVVAFMGEIGKGFSPSSFGDRFTREAAEGCNKRATGKPATIQNLARLIVDEPNHRGVANVLRRIVELRESDRSFADIEIDGHREFWDAVRLGQFDSPDLGLAEITHRRTYSRPKPPGRAISTIHKAKGLECSAVILMPCDAKTFPEKPDARCLLYVALSRAKDGMMLVMSRENPSPLFVF